MYGLYRVPRTPKRCTMHASTTQSPWQTKPGHCSVTRARIGAAKAPSALPPNTCVITISQTIGTNGLLLLLCKGGHRSVPLRRLVSCLTNFWAFWPFPRYWAPAEVVNIPQCLHWCSRVALPRWLQTRHSTILVKFREPLAPERWQAKK